MNDNLRACADFADRLVDLSDGELAAHERLTVEAHLADCPGCRAELHRLDASLAQVTGTLRVPSLSPGIHAGSRGARLEAGAKRPVGGPRNVPTPWLAAAGLACLLLLAFGLWRFIDSRRAPEVAHAPAVHKPGAPPKREHDTTHPPADHAAEEAAILRQIALIEQQARLQTWLDLMPQGPQYDEQRAANQALLAKIEEATTQ